MAAPVIRLATGAPGRPRKVIDPQALADATAPHRKLSTAKIARMLGVSRKHLRQHMKLYGIDRSFSTISDEELDTIIRDYKHRRPKSGLSYIRGYLISIGFRIPKERVRLSLQRVDPLGQTLRRRERIQRRTYDVPRPNHLWHIDGHHKMIRWGFVVHGIADGYCRTVNTEFIVFRALM